MTQPENNNHSNTPPNNSTSDKSESNLSKSPKKQSRGGWLFIIVALVIIVLIITRAHGNKIDWIYDYQKGLNMAKQQNKPLIVAFHSNIAQFSIQIKQNTYRDAGFVKAINDFVPVFLEIKQQPELFKKFDISTYPTHIIQRPDGSQIDIVIGYRTPEEFLGIFNNALENFHSTK